MSIRKKVPLMKGSRINGKNKRRHAGITAVGALRLASPSISKRIPGGAVVHV